MKTAKAQYSEDKKAYDNRTPEQVDAANAAAAAAISVCHLLSFCLMIYSRFSQLKKANAKPRGPKAAAIPAPQTVQARPPPPAEASASSDTSDDDDSEEDEVPQVKQPIVDTESSEDDDEEEEEAVPPPKKKRGTSAQPTPSKDQGKKGSKMKQLKQSCGVFVVNGYTTEKVVAKEIACSLLYP